MPVFLFDITKIIFESYAIVKINLKWNMTLSLFFSLVAICDVNFACQTHQITLSISSMIFIELVFQMAKDINFDADPESFLDGIKKEVDSRHPPREVTPEAQVSFINDWLIVI